MESFNKVKENLKKNLYPFFDSKNLLSAHKKIKSELNFKFENYIIVGIGGSSQGSKAVSHFLNVKNIFYFDHLNTEKIVRTLSSLNLKNTGFIFISKSGDTSEVLTLFDYIKEVVQDNLDLSKNFLTITENSTSPLYNLSTHLGIRIIEHHKGIGGRFSIFSHTGMVPISLFFNKTEDFYEGLDSALSRFLAYNVNDTSDGKTYSPVQTALRIYDLINKGN
jgi:glucose-6-phosphate isomerase